MRKHVYKSILWILFIVEMLAACNLPEATESPVSRMNDIQTEAALQTTPEFNRPTSTVTTTPTATEIPGTPTAYPTFQPELAVTVTPARPAVCPLDDPAFSFSEELLALYKADYLEFVNTSLVSGASFEQILSLVFDGETTKMQTLLKDLTADGVPELIVPHDHALTIYQCHQGAYRLILEYDTVNWQPITNLSSKDINRNGIPEIAISFSVGPNTKYAYDILEWNGRMMESILLVNHGNDALPASRLAKGVNWNVNQKVRIGDHWLVVLNDNEMGFTLKDLDGNGFSEIVFDDYGPGSKKLYYESGPWLYHRLVFTWNGQSFLFSDYQIDAPYYRYQALQEADRLFLLRDYDQALVMYDKVIGSTVLEWYSMDRKKYFWDLYYAKQTGRDVIEIPGPYFRADEYQYLSAYAQFRKMVLQMAAGKKYEAYYTYQLLDQIYTEQNPGFWHAEMGRIYWKSVEQGMSLMDACQPVIEYVEQNPKLLEALGDQWHGEQSHIYVAADVCPLDEQDVALLSGNP